MSVEYRIPRRELLFLAGSAAAAWACKDIPTPGAEGKKENEHNSPQEGDIIVVGNKAQLLSDGVRYEIRDLPTYMRRSKTPGKLFEYTEEQAGEVFSQYPKREYKPFEFALGQGDIKRENPDGGEKLIFAQGFLSSDSRPYLQMIPREDTFVAFRKRIKSDGWDPDSTNPITKDSIHLDSYIFTYSEDELAKQHLAFTLEDPEVIKKISRNFIRKLIERGPFDQNNGFGHSLGGIYILEMAMAYPFAFNNLIFVNSPIMGMNLNIIQKAGLEVLKDNLKRYGVDPTKVIDYLSSLWNDDYHKKLKKFFTDFIKGGGKVLIVSTNGDVIVPRESTGIDELKGIEGGETLEVNARNVNLFNPIEIFNAHGIALGDEGVLNKSKQMVGRNLSTS